MNIISLFSGADGLDLDFEKSGYYIVGNTTLSYLNYYLAEKIMEDMQSLGLTQKAAS